MQLWDVKNYVRLQKSSSPVCGKCHSESTPFGLLVFLGFSWILLDSLGFSQQNLWNCHSESALRTWVVEREER